MRDEPLELTRDNVLLALRKPKNTAQLARLFQVPPQRIAATLGHLELNGQIAHMWGRDWVAIPDGIRNKFAQWSVDLYAS